MELMTLTLSNIGSNSSCTCTYVNNCVIVLNYLHILYCMWKYVKINKVTQLLNNVQELWIAALLGDSGAGGGTCGSSAFAWAVLAGDKARGRDVHALTARAAAVQRDHAKVINYARIYGTDAR